MFLVWSPFLAGTFQCVRAASVAITSRIFALVNIDSESEVEKIAEKVWSLAKELEAAGRARIRELMKLLVERIEVEFSERYRGKRREYHPTSGRIMFRGESLGFASRGDWI